MPSNQSRSERHRLQKTLGELGEVLPFIHNTGLRHPEIGWWVEPVLAAEGCYCGLCEGARGGRDVHLGTNSRVAHIRAGELVKEHLGLEAQSSPSVAMLAGRLRELEQRLAS